MSTRQKSFFDQDSKRRASVWWCPSSKQICLANLLPNSQDGIHTAMLIIPKNAQLLQRMP